MPDGSGAGIVGLVEKPDAKRRTIELASIGRYVLKPDIFDTLRGLSVGSGGEVQLADAINFHAQRDLLKLPNLKDGVLIVDQLRVI